MSNNQADDEKNWAIIDDHARAIGLLCIYMATLDNCILRLLERLLSFNEKEIACITGTTPDITQRCELVRRLVHLKAPNDDWGNCVIGIMNLIQNGIGPLRNRYVHDDWNLVEDQMIRIDRRVKVLKPAAGEKSVIVHQTSKVSSADDINALTSKVVDCITHLIFLGISYSDWVKTGKIPQPPERAIELSKFKF